MASFNPRTSANSVASVSRSGSRHQLKRSLTELASPSKLTRSTTRKDRDRFLHDDRTNPLSPTQSHPLPHSYYQARSSVDIMVRSEGVTPLISPDQSRRPSIMLAREEDSKPAGVAATPEPVPPKAESLQEARGKTSAQVERLKKSLVDMHGFSTATTSKLDETYYAVLEKVTTLQNMVSALKDLAQTARGTHESFIRDSKGLEQDITAQVAALGDFKEHQESIESLQTRIQEGRTKIRTLSHRVDIVRTRVERWERLDKVSQEKSSRRLKGLWVVLSAVMLTTMLLFFFGAESVPPGNLAVDKITQDRTEVSEPLLRGEAPSFSIIAESVVAEPAEEPVSSDLPFEAQPRVEDQDGDNEQHEKPADQKRADEGRDERPRVSRRHGDPAEKLRVFDEL